MLTEQSTVEIEARPKAEAATDDAAPMTLGAAREVKALVEKYGAEVVEGLAGLFKKG